MSFISKDLDGPTYQSKQLEFISTSYLLRDYSSLSRCGRVKRAPNLDELDQTETYDHSDDSYYEERQ